jgi:NADPH-dependent F420 reductase
VATCFSSKNSIASTKDDTKAMNNEDLRVGLIGGTGRQGCGLALRWALAGVQVTIGSRSPDRASAAAVELNKIPGIRPIAFADNERVVAESDFIFLTLPFAHASETLAIHSSQFRADSILIDVTVPLEFTSGRASYLELPEGSASEHLQARLPNVTLVAAFKTLPAHVLAAPEIPLDCDVFIASNAAEARLRVIEAARAIAGLRPIDAGELESARTIERMTVLAINLNKRYQTKTARFRVVGV